MLIQLAMVEQTDMMLSCKIPNLLNINFIGIVQFLVELLMFAFWLGRCLGWVDAPGNQVEALAAEQEQDSVKLANI